MTIIITVIITFLVSMPLILWLERISMKNEDLNGSIEDWHNFRKVFDKGGNK
jgi:hypothetical protein